MADRRRVLIAGLGSIGQRHLRNLRSLGSFEVVALRSRGRPLPDDLRGPWLHETFDLGDALSREPEMTLVCVPPSHQLTIASAAAEAGSHLFVEKPLSDSEGGLDELAACVQRRGLVAMVGFNLRFHAGVREMKRVLDEGTIGRLVSLHAEVGQHLADWHPAEDYRTGYSAQRRLGGGVLLDLIHELDLARFLGGEVTHVSCVAGRLSTLEIDTEDSADVLVRFASGASGTIHMDYVQRPLGRSTRIIGDSGSLSWDYVRGELRTLGPNLDTLQTFDTHDRNDMYLEEMRHFLAAVEGREAIAPDIGDGIRSLRLALAAKDASVSRSVVAL